MNNLQDAGIGNVFFWINNSENVHDLLCGAPSTEEMYFGHSIIKQVAH
jgi:hypothetical protein